MRNVILILVLVVFGTGDALASLPPTQARATQGVQSDDDTTLVARRKGRKKKRKKRRRGRRRMAAPAADSFEQSEPEASEEAWAAAPSSQEGNVTPAAMNNAPQADSTNGGGEAVAQAPQGSGGMGAPGWAPGWSGGNQQAAPEVKDSGEAATRSSKRSSRRGGVANAIIVLSGGYTGAGRKFEVVDNTTENVRPYEATFVSLVGGQAELYPGSLTDVSLLQGLGVRGGYWQAIGLASTTEANPDETYSTTWNEIDVGVTYRVALGDTLWVLGASYGMLNFSVALPEGAPAAGEAPALGYRYGRAGLDLRWAIDSVAVLVGGGYRMVLGTGEFGDVTFPGSSAKGYDFGGGLSYQIMDNVEVQAKGKYSVFSHTLVSNDNYKASSAADTYWGGQAGLVLFY